MSKEMTYMLTMKMAKKMLEEGCINRELYERFNRQMIQKYAPTFSKLFT